MPKHKHSYSKGLNKDNSRSKQIPGSYYDALNLKVMTHDGLSTGSIENEKGNSFAFKFPYVPLTIYKHEDLTETKMFAHPNIRIVGWCFVDKYIVIFTKGNPGTGLIWRLEYNENTNKVKDVGITGELNVTDHLIFNGNLNFRTDNRIEAEGRYENDGVIGVYWTDNFNPLRSVNIMDPKLINTKVDLLDAKPNLTYCMPYVISIGNGDLDAGDKVAYAYRLISKEGTESDLSPFSQLVTLPRTLVTSSYSDFKNTGSGKRSVTFRVRGIDTNYAIIQHIAVVYSDKDVPNYYQFQEDDVPKSGQMDVILSGSETGTIPLTITEANEVSSGFSVCKSIDAKNNYLIAGNIKKEPTQIDTSTWDARAYRFKHVDDGEYPTLVAKANLLDESGEVVLTNYSTGVGPDWDSVPADWDAINEYNDEREDYHWNVLQQYKYQKNGLTLGGSGPNVSYKFIDHEIHLDRNDLFGDEQQSPWFKVPKSSKNVNTGIINKDGTDNQYNIINQHNNFTSPIIESLFTGYSRGEVYRFGIMFYTKKGAATFVNWIGDIKFPEPSSDQHGTKSTFPVGDKDFRSRVDGFSLGIEFTIDVSAIADQIGGYRIVRAERKESDRSRLGTGTIMIFDRPGQGGTPNERNTTLYDSISPTRDGGSPLLVGTSKIKYGDEKEALGKANNSYVLPDAPGFNFGGTGEGDRVHGTKSGPGDGSGNRKGRTHTILFAPFVIDGIRDTVKYEFERGDYIKTLGYYKAQAVMYGRTAGSGSADSDPHRFQRQSWVWKCRDWKPSPHDLEAFPIDEMHYLTGASNRVLTNDFGNSSYVYNFTYGPAKNNAYKFPLGVGDDTCYMKLYTWWGELTDEFPDSTFKPAIDMDWLKSTRKPGFGYSLLGGGYWYHGKNPSTKGDYNNETIMTDSDNWYFKEISYVRNVLKQYGGDTFEARSKTKYISTGHFQPTTSDNVISPRVFGGDVVVYMYGKEYAISYNNQGQQGAGVLDEPDEVTLSLAVQFPCESFINMAFNEDSGYQFIRDRKSGRGLSDPIGGITNRREVFSHKEIYLQQNISETKFFAKDFATIIVEEFPHRLWISEPKIDGELIDSWKDWSSNNILDVDGSYGPINKVINFQDRLVFYQDHAIGIAAINETSIANDEAGVDIVLGTGGVLANFRYMTTETGTVHQYSVTPSTTALYHYDATLRKLFKLTNAPASLSDMKGMSSFFAENVDQLIVVTDKTLINFSSATISTNKPVGVHSVFDPRHNRILFTFLSPKAGKANFTIGYNEYMDAFESFYSYVPNIYLNTGRRLLSVDPDQSITGPSSDRDQVYLHDAGDYGSFYGDVANTEITLIIAPDVDIPKIFTNIEYNSEVSISDVDIYDETLSSVEIWNDYQTTGIIPLIVEDNIKRRIRHWRHTIGRASVQSNEKARIRDYSIYLKLTYSNGDNKRLVLHDIIITYTPARD